MSDNTIRLRGSGATISMKKMPDEFIDAVTQVIATETDPFVSLAGYAYMINGLKINEIKELFILIDQGRSRIASREYVRQKIVTFYNRVQQTYNDMFHINTISPINWGANIEISITHYVPKIEIETMEANNTDEGDENEIPTPQKDKPIYGCTGDTETKEEEDIERD